MSTSITDKYLAKKVKNISQYTNILLNKVYKKDVENTKIFEACIRKYIDEFIINDKNVEEIESANIEFFVINKINTEEQKKMIITLLDVITNMEQTVKDIKFIDNIGLFSEALAIAFELEENTSPAINCDIGYKGIIEKIQKKYKPFYNEKLEHNLKISNQALKKCVASNIRVNKKFEELQNEDQYYLEFNKLKNSGSPPNMIVEVKIKDSSKELANFNASKLEQMMAKKSIKYQHTIITMEILTFTIFDLIFERKNCNMFCIRLPDDFLSGKTNKKKMVNLTKIKEVRDKICFEIDYGEIEKYHDTILEIKGSDYKIAIANLDKKEELADNVTQIADYFMIDSKSCSDKDEIIKYCNDNQRIFIERDLGEEVILEE